MSALYLNEQALAQPQLDSPRDDARLFEVTVGGAGGDHYIFEIIKVPDGQTFTHPPEAARPPTLGECAELIAHLFSRLLVPGGRFGERQGGQFGDRRSLRPADVSEREAGPPPDFEAGWEMYRRQALETLGCEVGAWDEISTQHQECWCLGVWEALEGVETMAEKRARRPMVCVDAQGQVVRRTFFGDHGEGIFYGEVIGKGGPDE